MEETAFDPQRLKRSPTFLLKCKTVLGTHDGTPKFPNIQASLEAPVSDFSRGTTGSSESLSCKVKFYSLGKQAVNTCPTDGMARALLPRAASLLPPSRPSDSPLGWGVGRVPAFPACRQPADAWSPSWRPRLAWKTPWTEEPGGLPFKGLRRVGYN